MIRKKNVERRRAIKIAIEMQKPIEWITPISLDTRKQLKQKSVNVLFAEANGQTSEKSDEICFSVFVGYSKYPHIQTQPYSRAREFDYSVSAAASAVAVYRICYMYICVHGPLSPNDVSKHRSLSVCLSFSLSVLLLCFDVFFSALNYYIDFFLFKCFFSFGALARLSYCFASLFFVGGLRFWIFFSVSLSNRYSGDWHQPLLST